VGRLSDASNLERIVNVTTCAGAAGREETPRRRQPPARKSGQGPDDVVARSNNTVEARFTLTAYTLQGVTGEGSSPSRPTPATKRRRRRAN
jgi:hypothetical protein